MDGSNAFALELHRRLANGNENLVHSPASIHVALAMLWAGAQGETAAELARGLHLGVDREAVLAAALEVLARWEGDRETPAVWSVHNAMFGDQGFVFQRDYVRTLQGVFRAPLERLDFAHEPDSSRLTIPGFEPACPAG